MRNLHLLVNSQTPLIQFLNPDGNGRAPPDGVELRSLKLGEDYRFSPGGVTRMVYPLLQRLIARGVVKSAEWIALNPNAPKTVRLPGITLHHISIDPKRMGGYGKAKEAIWATAHGLKEPRGTSGLFWTADFAEYTFYNRTTAQLVTSLDREHDFDLFYIHDFQQLPIGQMISSLKPKVFRWHIPFEIPKIPSVWKPLLGTYLGAYDLVIVSTERYREALKRFGYRGPVAVEYPYVDPKELERDKVIDLKAVRQKFGIAVDARVALVVARMDPAKGQDRAIAALARIKDRFPRLRLVLVGNGSFSGAKGGLGLAKSHAWRQELEATAARLRVRDRVIFTGHVSQKELDSLYDLCEFTILPSVYEGFGLVVVESWLHRRPTVVTQRAGVSELIEDGKNGLLFDPDDPVSLSRRMATLLSDHGELRRHLAERGHYTSRHCSVEVAVRTESELLGQLVG